MCTHRPPRLRCRGVVATRGGRQRVEGATAPAGAPAVQGQESGGWLPATALVLALGVIVMSRGWLVRVAGPPADARLIFAASAGFRQEFDAALADGGSAKARDRSGATALMYAAAGGDLSMVRRLLAAGAEVNAADGW